LDVTYRGKLQTRRCGNHGDCRSIHQHVGGVGFAGHRNTSCHTACDPSTRKNRPYLVASPVTSKGSSKHQLDWFNEIWFEAPAFLILLATAIAAVQQLWKRVLKPLWDLMKAAVKLSEMHQTLTAALPLIEELSDKFTPNSGMSLHDTITRLDRCQAKTNEDIVALTSLIETHIASVQRGGRRFSDPQ
jgi:hypothetical protein